MKDNEINKIEIANLGNASIAEMKRQKENERVKERVFAEERKVAKEFSEEQRQNSKGLWITMAIIISRLNINYIVLQLI